MFILRSYLRGTSSLTSRHKREQIVPLTYLFSTFELLLNQSQDDMFKCKHGDLAFELFLEAVDELFLERIVCYQTNLPKSGLRKVTYLLITYSHSTTLDGELASRYGLSECEANYDLELIVGTVLLACLAGGELRKNTSGLSQEPGSENQVRKRHFH